MKTKTESKSPNTAAEYRRRKPSSVPKSEQMRQTYLVEVPSGFIWELRPPNILAYMATGRYPQSLVKQSLDSFRESGVLPKDKETQEKMGEKIVKKADNEDIAQLLIFMRQIVTDACVKPRIVVGGIGDDELDPIEVDPDDFRFIFHWCMEHGGVAGVEGLRSFRRGQKRGTTGSKSSRKKLRGKALAGVTS